jgi:hypothetical protein
MKKDFLNKAVLFSALLIFTFPTFAFSQQSDSTHFNAIEYYYLRIAKGFGAGVDQAVDTEGGSSREYLTRPFLYWGLSDKLSFAFSNQTVWSNAGNRNSILINNQEVETRANHFSRLAVNFLPVNGLFLNASADISNGAPFRTIFNNEERENKSFALRGVFLSKKGKLDYHRHQRALVYYGTNWFDKAYFPNVGLGPFPLPLANELSPAVRQNVSVFSKGQTFITLDSYLDRQSFTSPGQIFTGQATVETLLLTSKTRTEYADLKIGHSLTDHFNIGAGLQLAHTDSRVFRSETESDADGRTNSESQRYTLSGWAEQIFNQNWRHRLNISLAEYNSEFSQILASGTPDPSFTQTGKFFTGSYALQHLWKAPAPAMARFLADRDDLFGHRLPKGGWQLLGTASWTFNFDRQPNSAKNDFKRVSLALANGKTSHLEIGAVTFLDRYAFDTGFISTDIPSTKSTSASWNYGLIINLTNYQFSDKLQQYYGWNELSHFDRLYGSLLQPGMVKLAIGAFHGFEYSHSEQTGRDGLRNIEESNWNPRDIQFYGRLRVGLKWGIELDMSVAEAAEIRNVALSVQLLRSLRLRAEYNSAIFDRNFYFSNRSLGPNSFVNVRLIGLF